MPSHKLATTQSLFFSLPLPRHPSPLLPFKPPITNINTGGPLSLEILNTVCTLIPPPFLALCFFFLFSLLVFSAWDNLLLCPLICFSDKPYNLVYWGIILSKFPKFAYLLINFNVDYFSHVRSYITLSWVCSFQNL